MTKEDIIAALEVSKGNVSEAATALGTTAQGVYHHLNADPSLAAKLEEIRKANRKPILPALQSLTLDEAEVALKVLASDLSPRAAARAVLIAQLAKETGRSAREVSEAIRKDKALTTLFEAMLPKREPPPREPKETLGVTLTKSQLRWTERQPRGSIAALVLGFVGKPAPVVIKDFKVEKKQTSFSLPLPAVAWLRTAAQERGTTAQAVLRQLIDDALPRRASRKAASAAHASA